MNSLFLTNIHQTSYSRYGKENAMQKIKEHLALLTLFRFEFIWNEYCFLRFLIDIVRLYVSISVNGYFMDIS